MTRRIVLAVTALAVIATGAGAASAATGKSHNSKAPQVAPASVPNHQLCLLLYREDPNPQHICVNW
jgi:hypothetical protein